MKPVYPTCYLFSGNEHHIEINLKEYGIPYTKVKGKYKGVEELSFLAVTNNEEFILDLCRFNKQESYLKVLPDRSCELAYTWYGSDGGERDYIGQLQAVTPTEALEQDAWTYVPSLDQYYVVEAK